MDPEPGELEPSSAGTSFEAPGQQCLSNWEKEQTSTVDGCLFVGVSSNLGEKHFSLEEFVIGTQTDSQIDLSKIVCQKISPKVENNEPDNEENKQFDPCGKGGEPSL